MRKPGEPRKGKFQCCDCGHKFQLRAGPHDEAYCPKCGSLYYVWLDFKPSGA
jgi:Zn finger protein HypA/HybF involved in hydrogenase expression